MRTRERNGALSCPARVKDTETDKTWGQRWGGRKVVNITEDLPL